MLIVLMIGALVILIATVTVLIWRESKEFCVTFFEYHSDRIKKQQYRIVCLSDLHDKVFGDQNEPLLNAIDELHPDAIIFAGDMVTSSMELQYDFTQTLNFIGRLAANYPIYYGMGNHEEKFKRCPKVFPGYYQRLIDGLQQYGVHIMENETVSVQDAGVVIYGLDLEHQYYHKFITRHIPKDYLHRIFGTVSQDSYSILVAHNPEHFPEYAAWGPDLVLSGHIHGGVVRLPLLGGVVSPQLKLFPKYDAGEFQKGHTTMLLSRGIGSHTIPIRVWNRAEILCIDIKK